MSKEARLIAAVVAIIAVIIGALVLFGGDDDAQVNTSDTSTTDTSTSAEDPVTTPPSSEPEQATSTTEAGDEDASTTGTDTTPTGSEAQVTPTSTAPVQTVAPGSVSLDEAAPWQGDLTEDEIRSRFTEAEASDDLCTRLVALTSLPNISSLADYPAAELEEFFTRWQQLADQTLPDTDGDMYERLQAARFAFQSIQQIIDDNGGTLNESAVDEVLGEDGNEVTQLLALFVLVADECPPPAL